MIRFWKLAKDGSGSVAVNSSVYLVANILNAAIPFLLLPVLTRLLNPAEYGLIAMFQIVVTVFAALTGLNTVGSASRKFFDSDDGLDLPAYIGSCIQILLATTVMLLLAVLIGGAWLERWTELSSGWLVLAVFVASFSFLMQLRLTQWQVRGLSVAYGTFQVAQSVLNFALSLWLVLVLQGGWEGRIWGQSVAVCLFGCGALLLLFRSGLLRIRWRPDYIRQALSFGLPLVPASIGLLLLAVPDRLVINHFLGLEKVGVYLVAVQMATAISIVVDALMKAYGPWLFAQLKRKQADQDRKIVTWTYVYFLAVLLAALLVSISAPFFVPAIAGPSYKESGTLLSWMVFGLAFTAMYLPLGQYIFFSERTVSLSVITIGAGVIHTSLVYLFVPKYGVEGAALAGILSAGLRFFLVWIAAQRAHPMPWSHPIVKIRGSQA